jgi:predicted transcriptional regulator
VTITKEVDMPLSTPMKLMALRMPEAEKRRLQELAREREVTLSYALREGARLYLEDAQRWRDSKAPDPDRPVITA